MTDTEQEDYEVPVSQTNQSDPWAMQKILGWMAFTFFLMMGAIKFAVKFADSFDKKHVDIGPYRPMYEHR